MITPGKLSVDHYVQPSRPSSFSDADAVTDSQPTSTQPTATSVSVCTTPLTSTPTQQASSLTDHVAEASSEPDNGLSLSENLPENEPDINFNAVDAVASCAMEIDSMAEPCTMSLATVTVVNNEWDGTSNDVKLVNDDLDSQAVGGISNNIIQKSSRTEQGRGSELVAMDAEEDLVARGAGDTNGQVHIGQPTPVSSEALGGVDSRAAGDEPVEGDTGANYLVLLLSFYLHPLNPFVFGETGHQVEPLQHV